MKNKKQILIAVLACFLAIAGIGLHFYAKVASSNVLKDSVVYIPTHCNAEQLTTILAPVLESTDDFLWVAEKKKYLNHIKAGKYELQEGMNSNALVNLLRSGQQVPVKLTFNNQHTLHALAGRISQQIEADSVALLEAFTDAEFLEKNKFNKTTALAMYIPNSYEVYWNTSATGFRAKMLREYKRFWNEDRLQKAKKQKLTPQQAVSLAAIVQKETAHIKERPVVAGLYLNRFHHNWPLQADPTVIFALKEKHGQDFEVKRVLNKDLNINSPYNTYRNKGIPPGPIAMPDISSIDAVLNPAKHSYYYMCASTEAIGTHIFASTLRQHNKNAAKYQRWLSGQGVNR